MTKNSEAADPKTYKAPHPVYVDGRLYKPGEVFVTAAKPGVQWEPVTPAEKVAEESADPMGAGDPALESMTTEELKALAVTKNVNPVSLKKADLIAAIKAANEPAL